MSEKGAPHSLTPSEPRTPRKLHGAPCFALSWGGPLELQRFWTRSRPFLPVSLTAPFRLRHVEKGGFGNLEVRREADDANGAMITVFDSMFLRCEIPVSSLIFARDGG